MTRRIASCVLWMLLLGIISCGNPRTPIPPAPGCEPYGATLLVLKGVRYLHIPLPEGKSIIVKVDALSPATKDRAMSDATPSSPSEPGVTSPPNAGSANAPPPQSPIPPPGTLIECPCEHDICAPMCGKIPLESNAAVNLCPATGH